MLRKALIAVMSLLGLYTLPAIAADHLYNSQMRPYLAGRIYLSQQAQFSHSNSVYSVAPGMPRLSGAYDGLALRTSLGVEQLRFLQSGIFYSNVNESDATTSNVGVSSQELGLESRMTFSSPMFNIGLGGGALYSWTTVRHDGGVSELKGLGFFAGTELQYFVTSRFHVALSAKQLMATLKSKSPTANVRGLKNSTTRVGLGVGIWM